MRKLCLAAAAIAFATSASAAGIDSRAFTCAEVQALIAAHGFVFISQATFGDFAVSNVYYCPGAGIGSSRLQQRGVATSDNPECPISYCLGRSIGGGN